MAFTLPPLPYDYSALEPHIDTQTMQIHHDKHHAAYVNNLNAALEGQIRSWMDHEGWVREKRQINGVRAWGYVRPVNWPPVEAAEPAASEPAYAMQDGGGDDEPF